MKTILKIMLLLVVGFQLHAQQEMSLPLMSHLANSAKSNPAFIPTHEWSVTLPSIGFSMLHTGPSFEDLYQKTASGRYALDGSQAMDKFEANNIFAASFQGDFIGVHYSWNDHVFSLNYGAYVNAAIDYTGDGAKLLLRGNGQFIGQKLAVGPALSINAYEQLGLGYARKYNDWSFGGRINLLFGSKALQTSNHRAQLETSSNYYALNLATDYAIHSADFVDIDMNTNDVTFGDMSYKPFGKNGFGVGVDLGISYQINYDMNVFASITNLGSIAWKNNTTVYTSQEEASFEGIQLQSLATLETASTTGMLDSIQKFVNFEKAEAAFKSKLNAKYLVGGTWNLSDKTTLDGVIDVTNVLDHYLPAVGVGIQQNLTPWVQVGGSLSYQNKKVNHLGLNTTFKFGPVQLFMASDNILTFIMPKSANTLHFRTGLNLNLGRIKKRTTIRGLG